jgi:hypothetical protein
MIREEVASDVWETGAEVGAVHRAARVLPSALDGRLGQSPLPKSTAIEACRVIRALAIIDVGCEREEREILSVKIVL